MASMLGGTPYRGQGSRSRGGGTLVPVRPGYRKGQRGCPIGHPFRQETRGVRPGRVMQEEAPHPLGDPVIGIRRLVLGAATLAAAGGMIVGPAPAHAWGPAGSPIHPGVQVITGGTNQCTANFVFQDSAGTVYLGQAAHCASTGGSTSTNGCITPTMPINTTVSIQGAQYPGTMVYNSWITMKGLTPPESNGSACAYNDFSLIQLDSRDFARVNPSVPYFGGPTGLRTTGFGVGSEIYSYGNSSLRFGLSATSPKRGISIGDTGAGWSHALYTVSPGIPGDSGSGFMDATGKAYGVLSTLAIAPYAGSNNAGDLAKELDYLHANSPFTTVQLVNGTVGFADPV